MDPLTVSLISATGKISCFKGLCRLSVEIFLSHSAKNVQRNPSVLCLRKIPVAKKFCIRGGGDGVSRFSVKNILSHTAENFCMGTV